MKVVFNAASKRDLRRAIKYYADTSLKRADALRAQVKEVVQTITRRRGGDHVGPHGLPCRRCTPFPYPVYYYIEGETLFILGLVHERRHPDYLRRDPKDRTE